MVRSLWKRRGGLRAWLLFLLLAVLIPGALCIGVTVWFYGSPHIRSVTTGEVKLQFEEAPGHSENRPLAFALRDLAPLPRPSGGKLLAAGLFQPEGLKFPAGLQVTWTLGSKQRAGSSLWILVLDEASAKWLSTGQKATVSPSGLEATGTVYHFSVYALSDVPAEQQEAPDSEAGQPLAPFLTDVQSLQYEQEDGGEKRTATTLVPTADRVKFVWEGGHAPDRDEPEGRKPQDAAVVHFPFKVTAPLGVPVRIVVDLRHRSDRPDRAELPGDPYAVHAAFDLPAGVARLEGDRFEGAVFLYRDFPFGHADCALDKQRYQPVAITQGELPIAAGGMAIARKCRLGDRLFTHVDLSDEERVGLTEPKVFTIFLSPDAPRGWYSFWVVVNGSDLWNRYGSDRPVEQYRFVGERDEFSIDFVVSMFEVRSHAELNLIDFIVATGRPNPSPDSYQPNLLLYRRLPDLQATVPVRRNAWVLAELQLSDEEKQKAAQRGISIETQSNTLTAKVAERKRLPPTQATYRIAFPSQFRSGGVADLLVSGELRLFEPRPDATDGSLTWEPDLPSGPIQRPPDGFEEIRLSKEERDFYSGGHTPSTPGVVDGELGGYGPFFQNKYLMKQAPWPSTTALGTRSGTWRYLDRSVFEVAVPDGGVRIKAIYRPYSEIHSNREGKVLKPGPSSPLQDDGFWPWYPRYTTANSKAKAELDELTKFAQTVGMAAEDMDRSAQVLRQAADNTVDWATSLLGSSVVQSSAALSARQKQEAERLERDRRETLGVVEKRVQAAETIVRDMLQLIGAQQELSDRAARNRPELRRWKTEWEQLAVLLGPRTYLAVGDTERFEEAVLQRDTLPLDAPLRIELAELYLRKKLTAKALFEFRGALRVDPQHEGARKATVALEDEILRALAAKTHGRIQRARDEFSGYLESRGLSPVEPRGGRGTFETVWLSFTTGPAGIYAALGGRLESKVEEQAALQDNGTLAYLGVQTIRSLVAKGHTIEAIAKGLTSDELSFALPLRHVSGEPYGAKDYRAMGAAMQIALNLPELQALRSEDAPSLEYHLQDTTFSLLDLDPAEVWSQRVEFVGDLGSAKNLLTLGLPMSYGTIGGKLVRGGNWVWGEKARRSVAAIERARQAGIEFRSGQEVVAAALGWERVAQAVAQTKAGSRLFELLKKSYEYRHTGSLAWQAAWGTGNLVANFGIVTGVVHMAEQAGGPECALVVDLLLSYSPQDADLCYALLKRARVKPQTVWNLVHNYNVKVVDVDSRYYKAFCGKLKDAEAALVAPARTQATRDLVTKLEDHLKLQELFDDFTPAGDMLANGEFAFYKTVLALHRGHAEEARAAAKAAADLLVLAEEQLNGTLQKKDRLEALARQYEALGGEIPAPRIDPRDVGLELKTPADWSPLGGPEFSALMAEGDHARLQGDLATAVHKYRAAALTPNNNPTGRGASAHLLRFCQELHEARRGLRSLPPWARPPLSNADADAASAGATPANQSPHASTYPLYEPVVGSRKFAVKRMLVGQEAHGRTLTLDDLRNTVHAELRASELAVSLGIPVPPVQARPILDAAGNVVGYDLISPWIGGIKLSSADEVKLVALREQLAEHRVFSLLLGDPDRHVGNYHLHNGRVVGLDHGNGTMRRFSSELDHLQADMDAWLKVASRRVQGPNPDLFYLKQLRLEQSLTRQDMLPAIQRAQQLLADPARRDELKNRFRAAFQAMGEDAAEAQRLAQEAVDVLQERSTLLDQIRINDGGTSGVPRNNLPVDAQMHQEAAAVRRPLDRQDADGWQSRLVLAA